MKCPQCGSDASLFRKIELQWNAHVMRWESPLGYLPEEGEAECTACDWSGETYDLEDGGDDQ